MRTDGRTNGYGLGVFNHYAVNGMIDHGGEAVGFLTQNTVYPDTKDAIIVFTNADFSGATDTLTSGIEKIVLDSPEPALSNEGDRLADVRAVYDFARERPGRPLEVYAQSQLLFRPADAWRLPDEPCRLGAPTSITINRSPRLRGGFVNRNYTINYAGGKELTLVTYAEPGANGRWEQFMIMPE